MRPRTGRREWGKLKKEMPTLRNTGKINKKKKTVNFYLLHCLMAFKSLKDKNKDCYIVQSKKAHNIRLLSEDRDKKLVTENKLRQTTF